MLHLISEFCSHTALDFSIGQVKKVEEEEANLLEEAESEAAAFFSMKSSCKLWRSWNSQVQNIALPSGNSAETQL